MPSQTDLDSRDYFSTFDGALADFELPLGAVDKARAAVRYLDFEHVYIPTTREHIALERAGETTPVAYITRTFVAIHPPEGDSEFVQIAEPEAAEVQNVAPRRADARAASAGARKSAEATRASAVQTCPTCYTNLPNTGVCDWCG